MQTESKYQVQFTQDHYTWPTQAHVQSVTFDENRMHLHLQDGRIVSVPLFWIPTLFFASPEDREKVVIGQDGLTLHWNPAEGGINEDLVVASYLRYDEPEL